MPSLNITSIKKIYCVAICGMGMGSLAGLLKASGYEISGSDAKTYPPMSDQLREQGILVHEGYNPKNVPDDADLVIIGNAVSKGHPEVEEVTRLGLPFISMADALAEFFLKEKQSIVVAGTHGKTTTASYLSWLLTAAKLDPGFLVGGIIGNFERSWRCGEGPYFISEGDEYDTAFFDKTPKFLHYRPHYAVLNAVEFDHADIYSDLAAVMKAFRTFVELIPPSGHLFAYSDSDNVAELVERANCPVTLFGESDKADYRLLSVETTSKGISIKFNSPIGSQHTLINPLPGRHNALNLIAAFSCLMHLKVNEDQVANGLKDFRGVKRRQEVRGVVRDVTVIDDFAHHPTSVRETLDALRAQYSGCRLWAIFEPRSNTSRRNIFRNEFKASLQHADVIILAPPYDNGKIPQEELLDVEGIAHDIRAAGGQAQFIKGVDSIVDTVTEGTKPGDVVAILSNGGFDGIHQKLLTRLAKTS
jgi:UDP-N-acetylmuramate: L-alanyl-gamma-D-glutamyl-meso-diaminopimelate ligase